MKQFSLKLGNMRAPQRFVVCPRPSNYGPEYNMVIIQSDKRIGQFDKTTGMGVISDGKNGHPGFHKLSPSLGAMPVTLPADVLAALVEAEPQKGDRLAIVDGVVLVIG